MPSRFLRCRGLLLMKQPLQHAHQIPHPHQVPLIPRALAPLRVRKVNHPHLHPLLRPMRRARALRIPLVHQQQARRVKHPRVLRRQRRLQLPQPRHQPLHHCDPQPRRGPPPSPGPRAEKLPQLTWDVFEGERAAVVLVPEHVRGGRAGEPLHAGEAESEGGGGGGRGLGGLGAALVRGRGVVVVAGAELDIENAGASEPGGEVLEDEVPPGLAPQRGGGPSRWRRAGGETRTKGARSRRSLTRSFPRSSKRNKPRTRRRLTRRQRRRQRKRRRHVLDRPHLRKRQP
mmetsp:Transcript_9329/g.23378  ORF Transcript_9329/g.23378 Transcript_9329/m.23378 type:complete len:287 (+) Transcript_9329:1040-1900(+)